MQTALKNRLEELERQITPEEIPYSIFYDLGKQIHALIGRPKGVTKKDMEKEYIRQNGTRAEFIKKRQTIKKYITRRNER